MRLIYLWTLFVISITPVLAAFDLHQAKESGDVCELPNGKLRANKSCDQAEVEKINAVREREYADVAQKRGVPASVVAQEAGAQLTSNPKHKCQ